MFAPVYVALLHHPVVNRNSQLVTTAVTNLDIHDIARTAKTYGARGFFLVTPVVDQHELVSRILNHWMTEASSQYHPDRVAALKLVRLVYHFGEVKAAIRSEQGEDPEVILTDARQLAQSVSYEEVRQSLSESSRTRPTVVVFGTGWGIAESFYPEVHRILAPVYGPEGNEGYNHLSVRAAAAAVLDRLFGR